MKNIITIKRAGADDKFEGEVRIHVDDISNYFTDNYQTPPITTIKLKSGDAIYTELTSDNIDELIKEAQK